LIYRADLIKKMTSSFVNGRLPLPFAISSTSFLPPSTEDEVSRASPVVMSEEPTPTEKHQHNADETTTTPSAERQLIQLPLLALNSERVFKYEKILKKFTSFNFNATFRCAKYILRSQLFPAILIKRILFKLKILESV
jgi:hypothetical protein